MNVYQLVKFSYDFAKQMVLTLILKFLAIRGTFSYFFPHFPFQIAKGGLKTKLGKIKIFKVQVQKQAKIGKDKLNVEKQQEEEENREKDLERS